MAALVPVRAPEVSAGLEEDPIDAHQYLTFDLGGEVFAIGILSIKEILGYSRPTPVPMAPSWIRGVINLRGAVVPLMDLQVRFGRKAQEPGKKTCAVIMEVASGDHRLSIGVVVDAVHEVIDIPPEHIEPAPDFGARIRRDFMVGMGKIGDRFVILLDMDRVLSLEEISQLGDVAVAEGA